MLWTPLCNANANSAHSHYVAKFGCDKLVVVHVDLADLEKARSWDTTLSLDIQCPKNFHSRRQMRWLIPLLQPGQHTELVFKLENTSVTEGRTLFTSLSKAWPSIEAECLFIDSQYVGLRLIDRRHPEALLMVGRRDTVGKSPLPTTSHTITFNLSQSTRSSINGSNTYEIVLDEGGQILHHVADLDSSMREFNVQCDQQQFPLSYRALETARTRSLVRKTFTPSSRMFLDSIAALVSKDTLYYLLHARTAEDKNWVLIRSSTQSSDSPSVLFHSLGFCIDFTNQSQGARSRLFSSMLGSPERNDLILDFGCEVRSRPQSSEFVLLFDLQRPEQGILKFARP